MVRPSYVLGGRAMAIIPDQATLKDYFDTTLAAFVPQDLQHRFAGNRRAQVNAVLARTRCCWIPTFAMPSKPTWTPFATARMSLSPA